MQNHVTCQTKKRNFYDPDWDPGPAQIKSTCFVMLIGLPGRNNDGSNRQILLHFVRNVPLSPSTIWTTLRASR